MLHHRGLRMQPNFQLLFLGVQTLPRELSRRLSGLHSRAILLHIELRVPHFVANLVFELVLTHLSLAIFQLTAHLVGLTLAVAYRDSPGQIDERMGAGSVNEFFQRAWATRRTSTAQGRCC